MIPHDRRAFLRNLTLAGVAVFTARHLKAIEIDATQPKDPKVVVGPYRKSWNDLYAIDEGSCGYRLSLSEPDDDYKGMTWREVLEAGSSDDEERLDVLLKLDELGLDGSLEELNNITCDSEKHLKAFAKAGVEPEDPQEGPSWKEVLEVTDPDMAYVIANWYCRYPTTVADLDDICDDWYDRVGAFSTPEGEAYLEVVELLESIKHTDDELYDAARDCFDIIEGSSPGNDFHGVYVKTRQDLGILRRILHAAGEKINIIVC